MKDITKLKRFSLTYGNDVDKAKAFVGMCYGLGFANVRYGDDDISLGESIDYVDEDGDGYDTLLIGGEYGIDLCNGEYLEDENFTTIDEAYRHLIEIANKPPTVVELNDDYDAIIKESGIEVGCQFITYEKLEEVMTAAGYEFL